MTSDGHEDHHATSAPADQRPSLFEYRPPPDPPAPYGYPPPTDPAPPAPAPPDLVRPAPDRVRGTASVPIGRPAQPAAAAPDPPAPTSPPPDPTSPPPPPPAPLPARRPAVAEPLPAAAGQSGPPPPPPPGPARGTAAVVAVPTANRAHPESGQEASFTPQPRVYQTAAGSPQPVDPPARPPAPPLPVRTTAASTGLTDPPPLAPATRPVPGSAPGYPAHPTHPASEPPPPTGRLPRQPGLPVYSDLIGPAPSAASAAPSAGAAGSPGPTPSVGAAPSGGLPPGSTPAGGPEYGGYPGSPDRRDYRGPDHRRSDHRSPGYGDHRSPGYGSGGYDQPTAAATAPPTGYLSQQREGFDQSPTSPAPASAGNAAPPTPESGQSDRPGLPVGVIVGLVLIGATVLVLGALSIPFLLDRLNDSGSIEYAVGDCVVQDGQAARPAECTTPDAYQIVARVDSRDQCDDPTQPAIEVEGAPARFFCLVPAAGSAE